MTPTSKISEKSLTKKERHILGLAKLGFALIPLNGKVPLEKNWPDAKYKLTPDLSLYPGNYGVVLQEDDLVIDVDPRNYAQGDKPLKRLMEKLGVDFKKSALVVQTGGGGWHLYFKKPLDAQIVYKLPEYKGIEFKTRGGQVVGPGSLHPKTGKEYVLLSHPGKKIQEAPRELLDLIGKNAVKRAEIIKKENLSYDDSPQNQERYKEFLLQAPLAVEGENGDHTTFTVACKGKTIGLSPRACLDLVTTFYNPLCSPPWTDEDLRTKIENAYRYSQQGVGSDSPAADFPAIETDSQSPADNLRWDFDQHGQRKKTLNNACNFFWIPETKIGGILAYNEFTEKAVLVAKAPWHDEKVQIGHDGKAWTDEDTIMLKYYLSRNHKFDIQSSIVEEAVLVVSKKNPNHPVRNYLNSLVWDGRPRIDTWLAEYCSANPDIYSATIGAKTLLGAVARVFEPGVKFDYMLVLEGNQGTGKSTVVSILGGHWYGDLTLDPHNKDTVAAMSGRWICEASEMEFTTRAEAAALKAFLTRQIDHVRGAYARHVKSHPRQCIFIGTTNLEAEPGYLKDSTGNRRFWPILTGAIDTKKLFCDRDQIFAEAVVRYKKGESLYIQDEAALERAIAEQHKRRQVDPWTDKIETWLDKDEFGARHETITAMEIWAKCLNGLEKNLTRRELCRIANVMQNELKWEKGLHHHPTTMKTVNGYKRSIKK